MARSTTTSTALRYALPAAAVGGLALLLWPSLKRALAARSQGPTPMQPDVAAPPFGMGMGMGMGPAIPPGSRFAPRVPIAATGGHLAQPAFGAVPRRGGCGCR